MYLLTYLLFQFPSHFLSMRHSNSRSHSHEFSLCFPFPWDSHGTHGNSRIMHTSNSYPAAANSENCTVYLTTNHERRRDDGWDDMSRSSCSEAASAALISIHQITTDFLLRKSSTEDTEVARIYSFLRIHNYTTIKIHSFWIVFNFLAKYSTFYKRRA